MSCSVTERVIDRAAVANAQGVAVAAGANIPLGCRLRGSNASLAMVPYLRSSAPSSRTHQPDPQSAALRTKPCCLLWCCCCKCPCTHPEGKPNDKNGPTRTSNNSDLMLKFESEPPLSVDDIRSWGKSFDKLLISSAGKKVFRDFLRGEYSEENILFWLACEDLKKETKAEIVEEKARIIYEDYISILSQKEVSLDSQVREIVNRNMVEPTPHTFDEAQLQIYTLMHRDSYPRFVNSPLYKSLSQQQTACGGTAMAPTVSLG